MRAKKSLGQHFLNSSSVLRAMADAADVSAGDRVLEIGPGKGSLTEELLSRDAQVIAIEKDARLIPELHKRFGKEIASGNLQIIEGDALVLDLTILNTKDYKLVANIPYYITGALIEKFIGHRPRPSQAALLIQKEVAERIARSKKESILSLSVKAYGDPHYLKTVPRGAFSPAPSVDSAILEIINISTKNFQSPVHEKRFFEILHAGFAHKRKLLWRNLESVLGSGAREALSRTNISPNTRAEDVPLALWLAITKL